MNNKYFKYFLLAGVLIVWGIIGVRIVNGFHGDPKPQLISLDTEKISYAMHEDTFSIQADYSDPFVAETNTETEVGKSRHDMIKPSIALKATPDYSFIKYVGLISGMSRKGRIAIINFKGNDIMIKEKGKVEDFRLRRIQKKELTFDHLGLTIKIKREL
jgi:hypothetical protein